MTAENADAPPKMATGIPHTNTRGGPPDHMTLNNKLRLLKIGDGPQKIGTGVKKIRHRGVPTSTGGVTRHVYGTDTPANRQKLYRDAHKLHITIGHTTGHQWTLNERSNSGSTPTPANPNHSSTSSTTPSPSHSHPSGSSTPATVTSSAATTTSASSGKSFGTGPVVRIVPFADLVNEAEHVD